jgi:hypothetical protein
MSNTDQNVDYAAEVVSRLTKDYAELMSSVATTLEKLRALPKTIDDEPTLDSYATVIRDGRDLNKRLEAYHDAEKTPYLRSGQGVDQFFFVLMEKIARRKKNDPAGGLDVADARVDDYMQRKLAAERAERQRIADEEARKAREEQARQDGARKAAEEAAAKAARARNAENIKAHEAEAARQVAIAEESRRETERLAQQAEDARIDTIAKPADMVRTRLDSGAMATMGEVPLVQIDDVTKLDKDLLWPFLKEEHILMALKAWAKTKSHKTPMAGATIKMIPKGQVR